MEGKGKGLNAEEPKQKILSAPGSDEKPAARKEGTRYDRGAPQDRRNREKHPGEQDRNSSSWKKISPYKIIDQGTQCLRDEEEEGKTHFRVGDYLGQGYKDMHT